MLSHNIVFSCRLYDPVVVAWIPVAPGRTIRTNDRQMEDHTAEITALLGAQMASLISAVPMLLALGPNAEQLVSMGKAMFQGAMQIPAASPVQGSYVQGIQQLAAALTQNRKPRV